MKKTRLFGSPNKTTKLIDVKKQYDNIEKKQTVRNDGYSEVLITTGKYIDNNSQDITVITSINGSRYKIETFINGTYKKDADIVDAENLISEQGHSAFEKKYTNDHIKWVEKFIIQEEFKTVLESDGQTDNLSSCKIITSISDKNIRVVAKINGVETETSIIPIDANMKNNDKVLEAKYTIEHNKFIEKFFKVEKFPTNTFLDPILRKLYFYDKNPMHSFYLLIGLVVVGLWLVSLLMCGRALPNIINKVAGKEAKMAFMDIRKNFCGKCKDDCCKENPDLPECILNDCQKLAEQNISDKKCIDACNKGILSGEICTKIINIPTNAYTITPSVLKFNSYAPASLYIKNNLSKNLIFKLKERKIDSFSHSYITPAMIITVIGSSENSIDGQQEDKFEFKLEENALNDESINNGTYKGSFIFEVIGAKDNEKNLVVPFEFVVQKGQR